MPFPELRGKELQLIMLDIQHVKGYSDIMSDPDTFHFLTDSGPLSEQKARLKIEARKEAFIKGNAIYWAIVNFDRDFLGFLAIHNYDQEMIAISYGVHPAHRRKGVAYRAMKMVMNWEGVNGKELEIATHEENEASFGLLTKLGLKYEGLKDKGVGKRHIFTNTGK